MIDLPMDESKVPDAKDASELTCTPSSSTLCALPRVAELHPAGKLKLQEYHPYSLGTCHYGHSHSSSCWSV